MEHEKFARFLGVRVSGCGM